MGVHAVGYLLHRALKDAGDLRGGVEQAGHEACTASVGRTSVLMSEESRHVHHPSGGVSVGSDLANNLKVHQGSRVTWSVQIIQVITFPLSGPFDSVH